MLKDVISVEAKEVGASSYECRRLETRVAAWTGGGAVETFEDPITLLEWLVSSQALSTHIIAPHGLLRPAHVVQRQE